jgi:hypothetical protein
MLLVALDADARVIGYVLYDLPDRHITIRQLCVTEAATGQGVARLLVDDMAHRHPERLGIRLNCRNDYPAARVWPRLDFEPLAEHRGRSRTGLLLTTWWRDFGHPTLFSTSQPPLSRRCAALDTDVFLDLVEPQDRPDESRHLAADWLADLVVFIVTKELAVELNNSPDPTVRERRRQQLTGFERSDVAWAEWAPLAAELRSSVHATSQRINAHDERDIRHVARAAAAGAQDFITRDDDLIRRLVGPAADLGITITTPGEFINQLALATGGAYSPVQLEDTTFTLAAALGLPVTELVRRFLNSADGERAPLLGAELRLAMADRAASDLHVVTDDRSELVALIAQRVCGRSLEVPMLRVAGSAAATISRHLAHLQRREVLARRLALVRVTDPHLSAPLPAALAAEGFTAVGGAWCASPVPLVCQLNEAAEALEGAALPGAMRDDVVTQLRARDLQPSLGDDIERRYSPLKLLDAGLVTYLLPIRHEWAEQLFDTGLSEQTLFRRHEALGISREHVYYSGMVRSVRLPARLMWYVSGDGRAGSQAIRAVSRLEDAVVDRPRTLHRRFQQLGVWRREQVEDVARHGRVLALRFSDTELLRHPIPLADLRELAAELGLTLVLRSITEVPERAFELIYRRGMYGPG